MLSLLTDDKLRRVLARMLDPNEFLGDHGIRSLSTRPPRQPVRLPFGRAGVSRRVSAGGIRHRDVRRQLELARPDLGADQRAARPRAAADVRVLRRRVPGRVPDRFGAVHDAVSRWRRSCRTAWARSSCATTRAAVPSTAARRSSSTIRGGTTTCRSTSTSTATTAPAWARATRPAGRRSSPR